MLAVLAALHPLCAAALGVSNPVGITFELNMVAGSRGIHLYFKVALIILGKLFQLSKGKSNCLWCYERVMEAISSGVCVQSNSSTKAKELLKLYCNNSSMIFDAHGSYCVPVSDLNSVEILTHLYMLPP